MPGDGRTGLWSPAMAEQATGRTPQAFSGSQAGEMPWPGGERYGSGSMPLAVDAQCVRGQACVCRVRNGSDVGRHAVQHIARLRSTSAVRRHRHGDVDGSRRAAHPGVLREKLFHSPEGYGARMSAATAVTNAGCDEVVLDTVRVIGRKRPLAMAHGRIPVGLARAYSCRTGELPRGGCTGLAVPPGAALRGLGRSGTGRRGRSSRLDPLR